MKPPRGHAALPCWLLFALVACARPPAAPKVAAKLKSESIDVEGFVVPRAAEDFQLLDTHAYERRELGTSVQYGTFYVPEARIDLYLYPVIVPELFSLASVLHEAQRAVVADVERVAADRHETVQMTAQRIESVPGVAPPLQGIDTEFEFTEAKGLRGHSHAFIAIRGRHFLKVRFTYAAENEAVGAPAFERFLASVVALVAQSPAGDPAPVGTTITRTTIVASRDNQCALEAWIVYGASLMEALGRGEFADTFERELAARSRAVAAWETLKQEGAGKLPPSQCVDPSLDAMLMARNLGLFEEYVWRYYAKPYWSEPPGLDHAAFAAFEKASLAGHDPVLQPGVVIHFQDAKR